MTEVPPSHIRGVSHDTQARHRDAVIDDLVARHRLTEDEAFAIRHAPRWAVTRAELVIYLAAIIIAAGLVRLVIALVDGMDEPALAAVTGAAGALTAAGTRALIPRAGALGRLAEALEVVAVGLLATSLGLVVHILVSDSPRPGVDPWEINRNAGPWSVIVPAVIATAWGLYRRHHTAIAGALITAPSALCATGALMALTDASSAMGAATFAGVACAMIAMSTHRQIADTLLRLTAAVVLVVSTPVWFAEHNVVLGTLPVLVVAAVVFAVAAQQQWIEALVAAATMVVIAVVGAAIRVIDDPVLEGVAVVATGLVMAVATWRVAHGSVHGEH